MQRPLLVYRLRGGSCSTGNSDSPLGKPTEAASPYYGEAGCVLDRVDGPNDSDQISHSSEYGLNAAPDHETGCQTEPALTIK